MTTPLPPPGQVPPFDQGNSLLGETPAQIATSLIQTGQGQRLALTVRTASATLTVFLGSEDAQTWARLLTGAAGQMSRSGLIVSNGRPG